MSEWLPVEFSGSHFHPRGLVPGSTEYLPDHLFSRTLPEIGENPTYHLPIYLLTYLPAQQFS
jgi:hypothetical protein